MCDGLQEKGIELLRLGKPAWLQFYPQAGDELWLLAVGLHIIFLVSFVYHRAKAFELHHMVPSWFVPPVGIIVACVSRTQ